jgi:cytochrome c oxidase assembly protein subunit 15
MTYSPLLHRLSLWAVGVALVTLTFGALVTSKNAGMAFTDWPTSDGYLMITYPWLRDFATNWDKFLEHGHRLAGMLIGIWSIGLVVAAWCCESRKWVRWLSVGILLGVIGQGLLGGFRVQLDERGLAMTHGVFAAVVFSLLGTLATVTSRRWQSVANETGTKSIETLKIMSTAIIAVLMMQYLLGSHIRHLGTGLHEHLALGIVALALIGMNAIFAARSGQPWLRRSGWTLFAAGFSQVLLGLATWVAKYGLASMGYVAVVDSIQQVIIRTAHMVLGTIVLMAAVVNLLKVFRVASLGQGGAA